jgi:hypothetical protein
MRSGNCLAGREAIELLNAHLQIMTELSQFQFLQLRLHCTQSIDHCLKTGSISHYRWDNLTVVTDWLSDELQKHCSAC